MTQIAIHNINIAINVIGNLDVVNGMLKAGNGNLDPINICAMKIQHLLLLSAYFSFLCQKQLVAVFFLLTLVVLGR